MGNIRNMDSIIDDIKQIQKDLSPVRAEYVIQTKVLSEMNLSDYTDEDIEQLCKFAIEKNINILIEELMSIPQLKSIICSMTDEEKKDIIRGIPVWQIVYTFFEYDKINLPEFFTLMAKYAGSQSADIVKLYEIILRKCPEFRSYLERVFKHAAQNNSIALMDFALMNMEEISKEEYQQLLNEGLIRSASSGSVKTVRYLIEKGADITVVGDKMLPSAAALGVVSVMEYLVSLGLDIQANDNIALKQAAAYGQSDMAMYLLKQGADIHTDHEEALRLAMVNNHPDTVLILLLNGADVDRIDFDERLLDRYNFNTRERDGSRNNDYVYQDSFIDVKDVVYWDTLKNRKVDPTDLVYSMSSFKANVSKDIRANLVNKISYFMSECMSIGTGISEPSVEGYVRILNLKDAMWATVVKKQRNSYDFLRRMVDWFKYRTLDEFESMLTKQPIDYCEAEFVLESFPSERLNCTYCYSDDIKFDQHGNCRCSTCGLIKSGKIAHRERLYHMWESEDAAKEERRYTIDEWEAEHYQDAEGEWFNYEGHWVEYPFYED